MSNPEEYIEAEVIESKPFSSKHQRFKEFDTEKIRKKSKRTSQSCYFGCVLLIIVVLVFIYIFFSALNEILRMILNSLS